MRRADEGSMIVMSHVTDRYFISFNASINSGYNV